MLLRIGSFDQLLSHARLKILEIFILSKKKNRGSNDPRNLYQSHLRLSDYLKLNYFRYVGLRD